MWTAPIELQVVSGVWMGRLEQRYTLFNKGVDVKNLKIDLGLPGKLRKRTNATLQRFDLADDDLSGLLHESSVARILAGQHFFDGQPDGRERIFELMSSLARQRLPAGNLSQVDEPLPVPFELSGHVVEGFDGTPDISTL